MKSRKPIESLILTDRKQRVILSFDLADLYGVEARVLHQAVKRNPDRFPEDFIFRLATEEFSVLKEAGAVSADGRANIRSQIVTLKRGQHAKYPPLAFTEHGAIMAATVLNSPEAVKMSLFVVRAFVQMREQLTANSAILNRLAKIDRRLLEHDSALMEIWTKLQPLLEPASESCPPEKGKIGFNRECEA